MDQERWLLIKNLFNEALELPPTERDAYLAHACHDQDILAEVKAMLGNDENADDFLEVPFIETFVEKTQPASPEVGDIIGTYRLERLLGEGGMGRVFLAFHQSLKKEFAIKLIKPLWASHPQFLERFRVEAESLGRLRHPAIVTVTDFGFDPTRNQLPFLVMEYLEGSTLSQEIRTRGALPVQEALAIFRVIAKGLDHAHDQGVLHRDLKPGNVILGGTGREVKIVDFGIANLDSHEPGDPAVPTGDDLGTPSYMAPELSNLGKASRSSDIYSFGVMMYETLTGQLPDIQVDTMVYGALAPCLDKNPARRPLSASEAVSFLEDAFYKDKLKQWKRTQLPLRACFSLAMVVVVFLVFSLPPVQRGIRPLELPLVDLRFKLLEPEPPDDRLVLITIDDAFLDEHENSLVEMDQPFGSQLKDVLDAGAEGVAIDLLLPRAWSQSPQFTNLIMTGSQKLALAAMSTTERTIGPEVTEGPIRLFLGEKQTSDLFAFTNLKKDSDGKVRKTYLYFDDSLGQRRPGFPARAATLLGKNLQNPKMFWINYGVDWKSIPRISWKDLGQILEKDRTRFKGKLVLVGAEFTGSGDNHHAIPKTRNMTSSITGLVLHTLAVDTLLKDRPVRDAPLFLSLFMFFGLGWGGGFICLYQAHPTRALFMTLLLILGQVSLSFLVFIKWGMMVSMANFILMSMTVIIASLLFRGYCAPHPSR